MTVAVMWRSNLVDEQPIRIDGLVLYTSSLYDQWLKTPHTITFPGGESLEGVRARVMDAIDHLIEKHQNENIALVAHRVPNKVICCSLLGIDNSNFWRIQQDTASTNCFVYTGGQWIVSYLNDTSYLKVLGKAALSDF